MDKEVNKAAKRAGSRPAIKDPSLVVDDAGPSRAVPSTVLTFSTDFNEDDVSDGGDVAKGTISPDAFLRMASGVSRAETEKPLPPLPSSVSYLFIPTLTSCLSWSLPSYETRGNVSNSGRVLTWIARPDAAPAA